MFELAKSSKRCDRCMIWARHNLASQRGKVENPFRASRGRRRGSGGITRRFYLETNSRAEPWASSWTEISYTDQKRNDQNTSLPIRDDVDLTVCVGGFLDGYPRLQPRGPTGIASIIHVGSQHHGADMWLHTARQGLPPWNLPVEHEARL